MMLDAGSPQMFGDAVLSPMQCSISDIPTPEDEGRPVMMSCENVHKTYLLGIEGIPALRGISLDVYKGEFLAIYGTSGGGKTSLLNILGTIDIPTKGNLQINGTRIVPRTKDSTLARLRLRDIGFVFQTFNLLATMTAIENVQMPMILAGNLSTGEQRHRAMELLTLVGMQHRADHFPHQLSGGEQQRVTIARAMANDPKILLLDEPTGDLDSRNTWMVIDQLLKLNRQGITIVMVTHDSNLKNFANRAVYVRDGKLFKEEVVPAAVREARIQQLADFLERQATMCTTLTLATEAATSRSLQPALDTAAQNAPRNTPFTEYRQPQDYRTYVTPPAGKKESARAAEARVALFNKVFKSTALSLMVAPVPVEEEQDLEGRPMLPTASHQRQCSSFSQPSRSPPRTPVQEIEMLKM
eukprot:GGOE01041167.1.p1 GENE.GGOE01041167.1~~GGOE01041167.1.p1  ORF type:complete len:413 (+),score=137.80 GGOE01041167.1:97-1335(+)